MNCFDVVAVLRGELDTDGRGRLKVKEQAVAHKTLPNFALQRTKSNYNSQGQDGIETEKKDNARTGENPKSHTHLSGRPTVVYASSPPLLFIPELIAGQAGA